MQAFLFMDDGGGGIYTYVHYYVLVMLAKVPNEF